MKKVRITEKAMSLLATLQKEYGELILVHSEGCCDGTAPLCTTKADFYIGDHYVALDGIDGIPYYMHESNQAYWEHLQIEIDVVEGISNSFSLESLYDVSFIINAALN